MKFGWKTDFIAEQLEERATSRRWRFYILNSILIAGLRNISGHTMIEKDSETVNIGGTRDKELQGNQGIWALERMDNLIGMEGHSLMEVTNLNQPNFGQLSKLSKGEERKSRKCYVNSKCTQKGQY